MVGAALVARLVGSGVRVRALARTKKAHQALAEAGAEPVYGDLTEPIGWRRDAAEADELWHLGLPRLNPRPRNKDASHESRHPNHRGREGRIGRSR